MTEFLKVHLLILPRWFAAPAAAASVLLGAALAGVWNIELVWALLGAMFLMAYAHSYNAFHDYVITGLDREGPSGHSAEKIYTGGQNLIRDGRVSALGVFLNLVFWALLAAIFFGLLASSTTMWLAVPFGVIMLCAPWYSWAKLHWHPEIPLGVGFAICAVWLGTAVGGSIDWWAGLWASIPFFLMFGVIAEHVDQWMDYETDWPKGARSFGMWIAHRGYWIITSLLALVALTYCVQTVLVFLVVSPWTLLSVAAIPFFYMSLNCFIDYALGFKEARQKAVLWGLGGITAYQALFVAGEIVG